MNKVSAPVAPLSRTTTSRLTASKYSSNPARSRPPSASLNSLNYGLQVRLITASKGIAKLARLRPPNLLDHSLQVYLQIRSITASKCISKLARSRPPNISPNSLDYGLQAYPQLRSITASTLARSRPPSVYLNSLDYGLQVRTITASKCISKLARSQPPSTSFRSDGGVYGDTGVTEVERVTGSVYLADHGVDRHHLISISSYHTMKIPTLSSPTFGLTRSIRDIVDPPNCVGSSTLGSIISSHTIPTLLEPELLFLMNSVSMSQQVRQSVDGGLSAFQLHCFTATASKWCISKCSLNGHGLVLLRLCSSTICGQIDRMYIRD